jgi:predicted DNA-binding protein (MmcQ/YjbR family)
MTRERGSQFPDGGILMNHQQLRDYCLGRPASEETTPFGPDALVYKVMNKMFALLPFEPPMDSPLTISLKVNPYIGQHLRETWPAVSAAYHMNKRHWIMVAQDGSVPDALLCEWIDESYALVVKGLTRAEKRQLEESAGKP